MGLDKQAVIALCTETFEEWVDAIKDADLSDLRTRHPIKKQCLMFDRNNNDGVCVELSLHRAYPTDNKQAASSSNSDK